MRRLKNEALKVKASAVADRKRVVTEDLAFYCKTGKRQDLLEKLYHALLSVPPTSVSSERAFSIAGNFVTPRRARMLDPTVDDLCFLHSVHARKRK